ncbi:hypothetical protein H7H51_24495 [Mycolicibacterium farcinogenes]|nr:hypothetical protein [Mycolicibacterium farcinogenes]
MLDVFVESLKDLIVDSFRPRVPERNLWWALVVNAFACLLHPLRDRIDQIFRVGDLLLNQSQLALNSLRRSLTQFMIINDPRCLVKRRLGSSAFPVVGQLGSLPA